MNCERRHTAKAHVVAVCTKLESRFMDKVVTYVRLLVVFQVVLLLLAGIATPALAQDAPSDAVVEAAPPSADAAAAEVTEEDTGEFYFFLGRFHPMILHFPIGLLVVLGVLELMALYRTSQGFESAIWVVLILTCVTSIVAAVFGLFLSWSDSYAEDTLFWHKWLGIAVAVLTAVAVLLKQQYARTDVPRYGNAYRVVLLAGIVTMGIAAHNGGSLTHGSNYLVEYMPDNLAKLLSIDKAPAVSGTTDGSLGDLAMAVMTSKCIQCHGPDKQSGKLRLDTYEAVVEGTEKGIPVVRSGSAMSSELIGRITLPEGHDDRMPPPGKGSLAPGEVLTLINWINLGLPRGDGSGTPLVASAQPEEGAEPAQVASTPEPPAPTEPAPNAPTATPSGPVDFARDVWPIFEARCIKCHGEEKQSDDLRLDAPQYLVPSEEDHGLIVAGNPAGSELYEHIMLPDDHDERMPKNDDPLSADQKNLIKRWIEQGAALGDWQGAPVAAARPSSPLELLEAELGALSDEQRALIAQLGQRVMPLARDSSLLAVDLGATSAGSPDLTLSDLSPIADHVTYLSLATLELTEGDYAAVGQFGNLFTLHLENTNVSDTDLAHLTKLEHLDYLNLFGTDISDEGIAHLKGLKNLTKLYAWKTRVTQAGADALLASLPDVQINMGLPAPDPAAEEEAQPEDDA